LGESSRSIEKCSRIRPQTKTRPSPARRLGSAERSERELALGRRTARIRRIDRLCVPAEVRQHFSMEREDSPNTSRQIRAARR